MDAEKITYVISPVTTYRLWRLSNGENSVGMEAVGTFDRKENAEQIRQLLLEADAGARSKP